MPFQPTPQSETGYVVTTTVTDNDGRETYQTSPIYHTRAKAEEVARITRKPKVWERSVTRTVETVRTAFEDSAQVVVVEPVRKVA